MNKKFQIFLYNLILILKINLHKIIKLRRQISKK